MSDEWSPNRYGMCGECGLLGELEGSCNVWVDRQRTGEPRPGTTQRTMVETRYYEEHWVCECGCTWWEQFRWRGQTKESKV